MLIIHALLQSPNPRIKCEVVTIAIDWEVNMAHQNTSSSYQKESLYHLPTPNPLEVTLTILPSNTM